jgi:hypothetical protein
MKKLCKPRKDPVQIPLKLITEKFAAGRKDREKDPILGIIGMGSGDGAPNARNHDEILYDSAKSKLKGKSPPKDYPKP